MTKEITFATALATGEATEAVANDRGLNTMFFVTLGSFLLSAAYFVGTLF